jgi:hypothetical protein
MVWFSPVNEGSLRLSKWKCTVAGLMLPYDSAILSDIPLVNDPDPVSILAKIDRGMACIAAIDVKSGYGRSGPDVGVALNLSAGPPLR